jgi:SAM-dependent methyltransferase
MLYYLRKYHRYVRTAGTQIARNMYEFSRDRLGLEIYDKDLLELPFENSSFDLVTIWHVLEHVPDPEGYVDRVYAMLKPGGKLVVEVPNFDAWTRRFTGRYWLGLDLNYHVNFFTPEALTMLLGKYRFTVERVHTFSLEYSIFISVQSLVSRITGSDQLIFNWLQAGRFGWKHLLHIGLFLLLLPVGLMVNLLLYFTRKGEVLMVIARKQPR